MKSSTWLPDEEEWRTGYESVSQTTEKKRFHTHRRTVTVIHRSLAVATLLRRQLKSVTGEKIDVVRWPGYLLFRVQIHFCCGRTW